MLLPWTTKLQSGCRSTHHWTIVRHTPSNLNAPCVCIAAPHLHARPRARRGCLRQREKYLERVYGGARPIPQLLSANTQLQPWSLSRSPGAQVWGADLAHVAPQTYNHQNYYLPCSQQWQESSALLSRAL